MTEHPINAKGWMNAYPVPRERSLRQIEVAELHKMLEGQVQGDSNEVIVVDVRRADCEVSARRWSAR